MEIKKQEQMKWLYTLICECLGTTKHMNKIDRSTIFTKQVR